MNHAKAEYFDGIAERWDGWDDLEALGRKLAEGLARMDVGASETVLDVGCGTGNLTRALLDRLGSSGRVVAVDLSARMIEVARAKVADRRVAWHVACAQRLPLEAGSCDRVVCCSVWPHFDDPVVAGAELARVLRAGGHLHVWHLISRTRVNAIHASAGPAVQQDVLAPARDTAKLLSGLGLHVTEAVESDTHYLVSAVKKG